MSDSKGYASTYGGYIQGESQLSVTINATQAYGSPISRYSASANGTTYSTQTFTTSVLTKVGTNTISATVIDGRERPGSVSSNITVLAYSRPQITNLKVRRCNANGTENDRGGYGKISFHCTITPLSNKNTRACSIKYRQSGATKWTNAPAITLSAYDQDCNPPVIQMSDAHSYEVQINLTDKFGTASAVTSISTGYCLYHIPASGKGITFGGIAEGDGFNVKMNATFGENVNMKKNLQVNGNVTGKYLTGTWLQTIATTDLGKAPPKVAVLDNSGWIYYRTLEELRADLGINDYIVEQGTSGAWAYRKWNSGKAECWLESDLSLTGSAPVAYMNGSAYYSYATVNLPFTFKTQPRVMANGVLGTGMGFVNILPKSGYSKVTVYVTGNQESADITIRAMTVTGRWQ